MERRVSGASGQRSWSQQRRRLTLSDRQSVVRHFQAARVNEQDRDLRYNALQGTKKGAGSPEVPYM